MVCTNVAPSPSKKKRKVFSDSKHWTEGAIEAKDVECILKQTMKTRKRLFKKGRWDLRLEAVLRSTEISAVTTMYINYGKSKNISSCSNPEQELEEKKTEHNEKDPFGLDTLFSDLKSFCVNNLSS